MRALAPRLLLALAVVAAPAIADEGRIVRLNRERLHFRCFAALGSLPVQPSQKTTL